MPNAQVQPYASVGGRRPVGRRGAVLVECLVGLLLVAGAAALLQLIASSTALSFDRALQVDATVATTDLAYQRWMRVVCGGSAGAWMPGVPTRLTLHTELADRGPLHDLTIRTSWNSASLASAAGGSGNHDRVVQASFRCDP